MLSETKDLKILSIDNVGFYTKDGELVTRLENVETFDPTNEEMCLTTNSWDYSVSAVFDFNRSMMRLLYKITYGWKAKGPIRKRVLHKLWREVQRKREG